MMLREYNVTEGWHTEALPSFLGRSAELALESCIVCSQLNWTNEIDRSNLHIAPAFMIGHFSSIPSSVLHYTVIRSSFPRERSYMFSLLDICHFLSGARGKDYVLS